MIDQIPGEGGERNLALRPIGLCGAWDGLSESRVLAGSPLAFSAVEVLRRASGRVSREAVPVADFDSWAVRQPEGERRLVAMLETLSAPRRPFAGLAMDRPRIMGVINVTPDSFSDGGDRLDSARAVSDGMVLWEAGAEILDVGGESTRPGSEPVAVQEELDRVLPVVEGLVRRGARVSIDSRNAEVMKAALAAGAEIVNDVTALTGDPESLATVAGAGCPVVLMHMLGEPKTMQAAPAYEDVALDVFGYLAERIGACEAAGIARENIAIDPGIGFGKSLAHNLELLDQLALFHGLGLPVLLGASRKSFIGRLSRGEPAKQRVPGSLAAVLAGHARGVQIFRVHDVAETAQALAVASAITWREAPGAT